MIPKPVANHFRIVDPILYKASLTIARPIVIQPHTDYFAALCESIISQQISTKAGEAIWKRFCGLFPGNVVTVEYTLSFEAELLRSIGISGSKGKYIQDLAQKISDQIIDLDSLSAMTNDEIIETLTKVKGIGSWTAEMFLMFTLGREDIFSVKDLGLRRGIQKIYGITHEPSLLELQTISAKWSPYRTYASMILWRSLE